MGYEDDKTTISWDAKLSTNLRLSSSTMMQLNTHYRSARLTPQGNILPSFLMNLGMRHDLFKKKASLTLTVSDIFNSLNWTRRIDTSLLYQNVTHKRNSQIIYLGFIYRFGEAGKRSDEDFKYEDKI